MSTADSTVEYRDIQGFPGYRVGNDGSVWSQWRHARKSSEWRKLKPIGKTDEYQQVVLYKAGKGKTHRIHRLVLAAFSGPCPRGMEACHSDGNRSNNSLENLRWDTRKSNHADKHKHGTMPQGETAGPSKLTEIEVKSIRQEYEALRLGRKSLPPGSMKAMCEKYKIGHNALWHIVTRKTWRHVA